MNLGVRLHVAMSVKAEAMDELQSRVFLTFYFLLCLSHTFFPNPFALFKQTLLHCSSLSLYFFYHELVKVAGLLLILNFNMIYICVYVFAVESRVGLWSHC